MLLLPATLFGACAAVCHTHTHTRSLSVLSRHAQQLLQPTRLRRPAPPDHPRRWAATGHSAQRKCRSLGTSSSSWTVGRGSLEVEHDHHIVWDVAEHLQEVHERAVVFDPLERLLEFLDAVLWPNLQYIGLASLLRFLGLLLLLVLGVEVDPDLLRLLLLVILLVLLRLLGLLGLRG